MTAASALATYDYLNTLRTAGRSAAVLEALAQAYTHQDTPLAGASADSDVLAQLAISGALGPLATGLYSAYIAAGGASSFVQDLLQSDAQDASVISALFGGYSSEFPSLDVSAEEAMAAYLYQQAAEGPASDATAYVQQLAVAAQASSLAVPLDLLA
jgi:hypothetical protein